MPLERPACFAGVIKHGIFLALRRQREGCSWQSRLPVQPDARRHLATAAAWASTSGPRAVSEDVHSPQGVNEPRLAINPGTVLEPSRRHRKSGLSPRPPTLFTVTDDPTHTQSSLPQTSNVLLSPSNPRNQAPTPKILPNEPRRSILGRRVIDFHPDNTSSSSRWKNENFVRVVNEYLGSIYPLPTQPARLVSRILELHSILEVIIPAANWDQVDSNLIGAYRDIFIVLLEYMERIRVYQAGSKGNNKPHRQGSPFNSPSAFIPALSCVASAPPGSLEDPLYPLRQTWTVSRIFQHMSDANIASTPFQWQTVLRSLPPYSPELLDTELPHNVRIAAAERMFRRNEHFIGTIWERLLEIKGLQTSGRHWPYNEQEVKGLEIALAESVLSVIELAWAPYQQISSSRSIHRVDYRLDTVYLSSLQPWLQRRDRLLAYLAARLMGTKGLLTRLATPGSDVIPSNGEIDLLMIFLRDRLLSKYTCCRIPTSSSAFHPLQQPLSIISLMMGYTSDLGTDSRARSRTQTRTIASAIFRYIRWLQFNQGAGTLGQLLDLFVPRKFATGPDGRHIRPFGWVPPRLYLAILSQIHSAPQLASLLPRLVRLPPPVGGMQMPPPLLARLQTWARQMDAKLPETNAKDTTFAHQPSRQSSDLLGQFLHTCKVKQDSATPLESGGNDTG